MTSVPAVHDLNSIHEDVTCYGSDGGESPKRATRCRQLIGLPILRPV